MDEVVEKAKPSASWNSGSSGAKKAVSWDYLQFGEEEEGGNL